MHRWGPERACHVTAACVWMVWWPTRVPRIAPSPSVGAMHACPHAEHYPSPPQARVPTCVLRSRVPRWANRRIATSCSTFRSVVAHLRSPVALTVTLACQVIQLLCTEPVHAALLEMSGGGARLRELTTCEQLQVAYAATSCLRCLAAPRQQAAARLQLHFVRRLLRRRSDLAAMDTEGMRAEVERQVEREVHAMRDAQQAAASDRRAADEAASRAAVNAAVNAAAQEEAARRAAEAAERARGVAMEASARAAAEQEAQLASRREVCAPIHSRPIGTLRTGVHTCRVSARPTPSLYPA